MNKFWNRAARRHCAARLCMRFADGGAADPATDPAATPGTTPAAEPAKAPPAADPAKATPPAKTYTDTDLETAKQQAIEEYKHHLEEAKDYEKMTAEEKVAFLEQQRESDKVAQYATTKLSAQELPMELLPFVQGKDEADTDAKIKTFKAAYDKGVQAGVEKRFKGNGYLPRGSAAGESGEEKAKRARGVSVK